MNKALPCAHPVPSFSRIQPMPCRPLPSSDAWRRMASVLLLACASAASPLMQRSHAADAVTTPPSPTLAPQVSRVQAVTVTITPLNIEAGADTWDFKVVLDTHSQDLQDDLLNATALVDETGNGQRPIAWQGSPPGSHHREGLLRFNAPESRPETITLRLERPNEPEPRIFMWLTR